MSVLLVAPPGRLGRAVVDRLRQQGDEVRVVDPEPTSAWRDLGAFVAHGPPDDADLIERAGQSARSIVLFDPSDEVAAACVEAARLARVERVIVCATDTDRVPATALEVGGAGYVVLIVGGRRWGRRKITDEAIAGAVDAADDLSGDVRLELDLVKPESWVALGLPVPG